MSTDKNLQSTIDKRLERVKKALEQNNMNAFIAKNSKEACEIAQSLMKEGALVGSGGSETLAQCGMLEILRSGKYEYLDRDNTDDVTALYRKTFCADYYLCSSNAVTEKGELYNVDGRANRVACICYGPTSVIMIVGRNKIVHNLDDAVRRVKTIAAPANAPRVKVDTYCSHTGICKGVDGCMADGCTGERICATYVVCGYQRVRGRINVILVDEELGY